MLDGQKGEMEDEDIYIKTGKLVLFIDSNIEELARSKASFDSLTNFKGEAMYFEDGEETLQFLSSVRTKDGQQSVADLIFLTYSVAQADGLQLMEQIINFCRVWSPVGVQLKPKIIICSSFSLQTFQNYVMSKGALGFIQLPLTVDALRKCCVSNKIIKRQ